MGVRISDPTTVQNHKDKHVKDNFLFRGVLLVGPQNHRQNGTLQSRGYTDVSVDPKVWTQTHTQMGTKVWTTQVKP